MLCEPVFGYGQRRARREYSGPGYGEAVACCGGERNPVLHLTTDRRLGIEDSIALSWGSQPPPRPWEEATAKHWQTTDFWRQWITGGEFPDHPWREAAAQCSDVEGPHLRADRIR